MLAEFLCLIVLLVSPTSFKLLLLILIYRCRTLVIVVALESISVLAVALFKQTHRILLHIRLTTLCSVVLRLVLLLLQVVFISKDKHLSLLESRASGGVISWTHSFLLLLLLWLCWRWLKAWGAGICNQQTILYSYLVVLLSLHEWGRKHRVLLVRLVADS